MPINIIIKIVSKVFRTFGNNVNIIRNVGW